MEKELSAREKSIPKLREIFRQNGFEGTSLSEIINQTGLGKSSLYHFFPQGKTEMAEAVLHDIDQWFNENVFLPLRKSEEPVSGIHHMFKEVNRYFKTGDRICLVGAFALDNTRELFPSEIKDYFKIWVDSLAWAINKKYSHKLEARKLAEETVASIQGALVLTRAQNDTKVFTRIMKRLEKRILSEIDG